MTVQLFIMRLAVALALGGLIGLEQQGREDRFVHKLLSFAVAYADRTFDDFDELIRRKAEVAEAWRAKPDTLLRTGD